MEYESNFKQNNPEYSNKKERKLMSMEACSGIRLSDSQFELYRYLRDSKDSEVQSLCDQIIIYSVLDDEQKILFKKKFDHIRFTD